MSTRTPLYASIPRSALPRRRANVTKQPTVDELFDELDSDSGFSDDGDSVKVSKKEDEDTTDRESSHDEPSEGKGSALLDAPSLFPNIELDPAGPAWTKWTSSKVTCMDTAYGTTEDKMDCIWLVAGCQDGSVWIFCSMSVTSSNTARTPRTDSMPNLLHQAHHRPSLSRKSSDTIARRAFPSVPRSPGSGSRVGSASMAGSRSASAHGHAHGHARKNRSISLALHSSPNLGSSPTAPRKASATISVSDFDATGHDTLDKDLPSPPRSPALHSPSIHGAERPSFAFEELVQPTQTDFDKVRLSPVAQVTLDASHSPIASIKLLPPEGNTAHFIALSESGRVFKLACQDGTLLRYTDLTKHTFPRQSIARFSDSILSRGNEAPWLLCISKEGGLALPVDTSDLKVLSPLPFSSDSHLGMLQVASDTFLLETRTDGHMYVSQMPDRWGGSADIGKREAHDAGSVLLEDQTIRGMMISNEDIIVWFEGTVQIFRLENQKVQLQKSIKSASRLQKVLCLSTRRLALVSEDFVQFVSVETEGDTTALLDFSLSERIESASILIQPTSTDDCVVICTRDSDGTRRLCLAPLHPKDDDEDGQPDLHIAYSTIKARPSIDQRVTASVKIDESTYVTGHSFGHIAFYDMNDVSEQAEPGEAEPLGGVITTMAIIDGERRLLYAGSASGEIGIWAADSQERLARHHLFATPVQHIQGTEIGTLVIGADGALALCSGLESPTLYPATRHALERIHYRQGQLLLIYSHGLARLWDTDAGKLLKSLDHTGCVDILAHVDGWQEIVLAYSSANALSFDLRKLVDSTAAATSKGSKVVEDQLNPTIRWLLSRYCLPVQEEYVQTALRDHLQIVINPLTQSTTTTMATTSIFASENAMAGLTISQTTTAMRLLIIVALLRVFLNFPDTERYANEVIAYYATQMGDAIGSEYKDASMDLLADFWLDESNEIRQAARMLFGARVGRLSESEVFQEVQDRQAKILNSQASDPKGLLILGEIAIAKRDQLSSGSIRNIAYQIAKSLGQSNSPGSQSISLELCIRGFTVFQNCFDAVKVLRDIFHLATSASTLPSATGLRNLARQAVLSIASVNAPLFMTVLSFDAIHDHADTEQRAKTLKLIAFMIRKKPVVLFSSLPRLVEMVVRSLDPRSTMRGALQQTATYILSELVKTYPSIAFHGKSQRLAVGTHEGAVVVYDLKTATRLYILDSHKKRASALSYSPDGRRLVTVSLEESTVKVWKVGLSLLGLLTPAGPPPQRHGVGSNEAYKTLDFKLAAPEEAMMTAAAQLEWLTVDWADERRVKITIRETALTFSVV